MYLRCTCMFIVSSLGCIRSLAGMERPVGSTFGTFGTSPDGRPLQRPGAKDTKHDCLGNELELFSFCFFQVWQPGSALGTSLSSRWAQVGASSTFPARPTVALLVFFSKQESGTARVSGAGGDGPGTIILLFEVCAGATDRNLRVSSKAYEA